MIRFVFLFCMVLTAAGVSHAQTMPELRDELLRMRERDQTARVACANGTADEQAKCLLKTLEEIDKPNIKRLNEIFVSHGFPMAAMVGRDGVQAFVLLMQHSGDIELKKKSQVGMARAHEDKIISPMDYTNFVDLLLVDQGKPQIYGSRFETRGGKLVMNPVEDPKNLDVRRREAGLPPISEYMKMLKEFYKLEVVMPQSN